MAILGSDPASWTRPWSARVSKRGVPGPAGAVGKRGFWEVLAGPGGPPEKEPQPGIGLATQDPGLVTQDPGLATPASKRGDPGIPGSDPWRPRIRVWPVWTQDPGSGQEWPQIWKYGHILEKRA